jgi:hypothetical protein
MKPRTEYHDARRIMIELYREDGDDPVNIAVYSEREREFMKATCASTVLLHTVCRIAGFNAAEAKRGLKAMELEQMIERICER